MKMRKTFVSLACVLLMSISLCLSMVQATTEDFNSDGTYVASECNSSRTEQPQTPLEDLEIVGINTPSSQALPDDTIPDAFREEDHSCSEIAGYSTETPLPEDSAATFASESQPKTADKMKELPAAEQRSETVPGQDECANPQIVLSQNLLQDLAGPQADSMIGYLGQIRSADCSQLAATFSLSDYSCCGSEDQAYAMLWNDLNESLTRLKQQGVVQVNCVLQGQQLCVLK